MTADDVLREFTALSVIPRCSGHEKAAADYVANQAREAGYPSRKDKAGNIAVYVPGSRGMEDAPVLILQGHLDMVCVKDPGSDHDFSKDPIIPVINDDFMTARGTTLGADNGIAVALALAVMKDRSLPHGPLELLFTVEEETGLIGATELGEGMVHGRFLVNLDFEEDYQICIGCAGGNLITAEGPLPVGPAARENQTEWKLAVHGLKGGHSGMDIGTGGENIYRKFASFLRDLMPLKPALTGMIGEGKVNAIPTNCLTTILLQERRTDELMNLYGDFEEDIRNTYADSDIIPRISLEKTDTENDTALTAEGLKTLVDLVTELPAGVLSRNEELGGQISTSANPGVLSVDAGGNVHLEISVRSDRQENLDGREEQIRKITGKAGLPVVNITSYPPWPPAAGSPLGTLCQDCREGIFENPAEMVTIHAGLECGVISSKLNGIDAVSVGPNIFDVHTTRERIQVPSLGKFVDWLRAILARQGDLQ